MKYSKYNVVVIGSGISGLYLANKLSENKNFTDGILVITKEELFSGSSSLAQGGIVSVIPELNKSDSVESHIKDTLGAGCGLNNLNVVKYVSEESSLVAQELMRFGVEFDKLNHNLNFTLEGAHSCPRILHCQGDSTGRVIEKTLCDRLKKIDSVDIYENTLAVDLLVDEANSCRGVVVFNSITSQFEAIYTNNLVIATGGIGQLYKFTTNPSSSTGDGISLAKNAGAQLENMEFVQFHPTALYCKGKKTMPLVSESARGEGAKLVNLNGDYFAKLYHNKADLAPRDVVTRAIISEIANQTEKYVNLDISQIGIENFKQRFPTITLLCKENNIDLSQGLIPVAPAEHYFMGGVKTDLNSKTSVENLYAIGECASTGLHGANRLASNSLLECAVFAQGLYKYFIKKPLDAPDKLDLKVKSTIEKYENIEISNENINSINELFAKLKETMTNQAGIIRSATGLKKAKDEIASILLRLNTIAAFSKERFELTSALNVANSVVESALKRQNSIGAHFREDFPLRPYVEQTEQGVSDNNDELLAQ